MQELKHYATEINYEEDLKRLERFFLFYTDEDSAPKYVSQLQSLAEDQSKKKSVYKTESTKTLEIDLNDLAIFDDSDLLSRFEGNTLTYLNLLYKAIDRNCPTLIASDLLFYHRSERLREKNPEAKISEILPPFLTRQYSLKVKARAGFAPKLMRQINSGDVGRLVRFRGLVVKCSAPKPFIRVSTYICDSCGSETYVETFSETLELLEECPSEKCRRRNVKGTLTLQTRGSKFSIFQKLQVQEIVGDVPFGCVPMTMEVECYDDTVNVVRVGESVEVTGIFAARKFEGMRGIKAGLLRNSFVMALNVVGTSRDSNLYRGISSMVGSNLYRDMTEETIGRDTTGGDIKEIYNKYGIGDVIKAFAPEIYGLDDVKKLIVLSVIGSPSRKTEDNMFVRGNINVLIVGDPGIAKSQLLKTAVGLCDGIYTTGYGSSTAGLTAAVTKDPTTGEPVLEGGALVLADGTVCAIDELDKMSEIDRASVHEVMEQHTVSISKAGINTTLNARTTVIAAANPVGVFNPKQSLSKNLNMPVSLLSRFDAILLLKDVADENTDRELAEHIMKDKIFDSCSNSYSNSNSYTNSNSNITNNTNSNNTNSNITNKEKTQLDDKPELNYSQLKEIISKAKTINPSLNEELKQNLVDYYTACRKDYSHLTPRHLLSTLRLSMAHARLRLSDTVSRYDVDEAIRLASLSLSYTEKNRSKVSPKYEIFNSIKSLMRENTVKIEEVYNILGGTYGKEKIDECLIDFQSAGVWEVSDGVLEYFNMD